MSRSRVADGAFFVVPAEFRRRGNDLRRAEVRLAQRERMLIAVTELVAQHGYRGVGVRDIVGRAKVSLATFYDCFTDKDACYFAAYDRFVVVLLGRLEPALEQGTEWEERVRQVVRSYLAALDADPVVARAFEVEMDALGRPARERRRRANQGMGRLVKAMREETWPDHPTLVESAYVGVVCAVQQLASDALDGGYVGCLADMTEEISGWVVATLGAG
ncbi:TetR/AcrR family transcriptional regulator [Nocardioides marmoriginsengisoli]|nr:TetR/AcrR family transcriptional regulator [Nocardioides marmoriginsengisoli]